VASGCLLVTDDPEPYRALGLPHLPDAVHGVGPAGGVLAALEHIETPFALVVACDMPGVSAAVLTLLRDRDARFEAVVPEVNGLLEPLCARWARSAAPVLRRALEGGTRKMSSLLGLLLLERVPESALRIADPGLELVGNVNTPDDLERLRITRGRLIQ
jgi:molybdopterin-guanine dinucleotide biosynthesis protein A